MTQDIKKQHNYQHKTTITQDTTESKYILNTFTKHIKHYRRSHKTDIHDTGHKDIENVNSDTRHKKIA